MHFQRCLLCLLFQYEMASGCKTPGRPASGRENLVTSSVKVEIVLMLQHWQFHGIFNLKRTIILFIVVSRMIILITRVTSDGLWPRKWGNLTWQRAHLNCFWSKKYDIATWRIFFLLSLIPLWRTIFPKKYKTNLPNSYLFTTKGGGVSTKNSLNVWLKLRFCYESNFRWILG